MIGVGDGRLAAIGLAVCFILGQPAAAQDDTSDSQSATFGTTVVVPFGLVGDLYYLPPDTDRLPDFDKLVPVGRIYTNHLNVPERDFTAGFPGVTSRIEWFAIDYNGRFWAEKAGKYKFSLQSDDGSRLYIDDQLQIDNDGIHAAVTVATNVTLKRGIHRIRVSFFQGPRYGLALVLAACVPDGKWKIFNTDDMKPPSNTEGWDPADVKALEEMQREPGRKRAKTGKDLAAEDAAIQKITSGSLPHDFAFRSEVLQFPSSAGDGKSDFTIAYEVPLANLRPEIDNRADTRTWRFILLASITDDGGKVVDEMKIDVPFATTEGHSKAVADKFFTYARNFRLPAGKFKIITGVADRASKKVAATSVDIENDNGKSGVKLSSLVMVDHVQRGSSQDGADPLLYQGQRLVPMLSRSLAANEQRPVFFVAKTDAAIAEKPKLEVEFLVDGKVAIKETPRLPEANDSGLIPMSFGSPACPGKCELRLTAVQGTSRSTESIVYQIAP